MTRPRSLKARFIVGSVLWTLGLLGASHLAFVYVTQYVPHVLRIQHWMVIGILALVFMLGGLTQVRRGMAPINDLRQRLVALRQGRARRLDGTYPSEVQPLVDDLNALLDHREGAVRRAQAKAGDLAHGLKTPLAILAQDAARAEREGQPDLAASIRREVEGMRRQVDFHLAQARAAASAAAPGAHCLVAASVEPLGRTLDRLYADRRLALRIEAPPGLSVAVERQDLDEMLGNLLDNACKWARALVTLAAAPDGTRQVLVVVEDDGEGVPETLWAQVLDRGVRADQTAGGSGLGLAIVRDLVEVYGGSIALRRASIGGLRAELRLPRAGSATILSPPHRSMPMRSSTILILLALATSLNGQATNPESKGPNDLLLRVGLTADEASKARSGQAAVRVLPANASTEVAVAGAIRIRGDLERLVTWLRDIQAFRKAIGTEAVGVIGRPARPEDFAQTASAGLDLDALQRCRPAACDIRMPADFVSRFRSEVPWGTPEAAPAAATLGMQLLAQYAAAYQAGGDAALGAHHDQRNPKAVAAEFQDMLRRATTLWNLAYPFASYLETFPEARPPDVEERFYWTRESDTRQPVMTLHHVVLQRLADKSLRLADKQFYASRDLDTALLVGQATPLPDGTQFDLVVAVRGRSGQLSSMAARVIRGRIERELADTLAMYLDWLRKTFALG